MKENIDFFISAIRYEEYDPDRKYIERFKVHTNYGVNMSSETLWRRDIIILRIKSGKIFYTIKKEGDNIEVLNQVFVNKVNGEDFLQIKPNNIAKDDLGAIEYF